MNPTIRKWIVGLKRRPQNIPLVLLTICCMVYTFQLTAHSNASMYVSSQIIAFYVFVITLFSMLGVFSFTNVFAHRQKHKGLWLAVVYILCGVQLLCDYLYINILQFETVIRENPVPITADIAASGNWTIIHMVLLAITVVVIILMPVYHKMLLKIDTSVEDADLVAIDDDDVIETAEEDV